MTVSVPCLTGTMKEKDSSTVRSTTGLALESSATAVRRLFQQDLSWLQESKSTTQSALYV